MSEQNPSTERRARAWHWLVCPRFSMRDLLLIQALVVVVTEVLR